VKTAVGCEHGSSLCPECEKAFRTRAWRYRRMAREMAAQVPIHPDVLLDCMRAAGDALCSVCGLEYIEHPQLANLPTFHLTCTGKVVKL